ncbi:MAG: hypothetical protein JWO57_187 [Pseudonocardiales bacterium]|nr:hypothetical protein [Pseudonocardiales bacterium]
MSRNARTRRGPRYLNPLELIDFTRFFAGEVAAGKYPYIDFDTETRWHQRIYRDQRLDVWLISWLPSQGTQLHDHGGSSGSFTVLSGVLAEAVFVGGRDGSGGRLSEHGHPPGSSVGFGPHYVHDVRNLGDEPAVSVHAYSRPLASMTYYDVDDGALVRLASLATDDPEPQVDVRAAS